MRPRRSAALLDVLQQDERVRLAALNDLRRAVGLRPVDFGWDLMLDDKKTGLRMRMDALERYAEELETEVAWLTTEVEAVRARIVELEREAA